MLTHICLPSLHSLCFQLRDSSAVALDLLPLFFHTRTGLQSPPLDASHLTFSHNCVRPLPSPFQLPSLPWKHVFSCAFWGQWQLGESEAAGGQCVPGDGHCLRGLGEVEMRESVGVWPGNRSLATNKEGRGVGCKGAVNTSWLDSM